MKLKDGVDLVGIRPELVVGMMITQQLFNERNSQLVITSACDGIHSFSSLHYSGCAFDVRTHDFHKAAVPDVHTELSTRLGEQFDCILEKDHIHIEFQPKRP